MTAIPKSDLLIGLLYSEWLESKPPEETPAAFAIFAQAYLDAVRVASLVPAPVPQVVLGDNRRLRLTNPVEPGNHGSEWRGMGVNFDQGGGGQINLQAIGGRSFAVTTGKTA